MKNNTHFKSTMLVIALAFGSGMPQAFAVDNMNEANQTAYTEAFKALDVDNSGTLTKSEANKEKLFSKHFAEADVDHNATLDEQEYTNYKSKSDQKNVKRIVKDSVITSKVKGELLKDEGLKSLKVSVETNHGVVLLSGFVETEEQILQAAKIASETEGVKSVSNSLLIKKQ